MKKVLTPMLAVVVFLLTAALAPAQPGLTVNKGGSVTVDGFALFGPPSASHIAIDNNDIQAKTSTGANYARLDLNFWGGDVNLAQGGGKVMIGTTSPVGKLEVVHNSSTSFPHLRLVENDPGGFARLEMKGTSTNYWHIAARGDTDPEWNVFFFNGTSGIDVLSVDGDDKRVGVMTTNPLSVLHVKQNADNTNDGIRTEATDGTRWNTYVDGADDYNFAFDGGLRAWIYDNDGSYHTSSDRRLKTDIQPLEPVLERVLKLKPSWYRFKDARSAPLSLGFIAQEVEEQFPDLVPEKDGIKGLAYDHFGVLAIRAIQELAGELETEKAKNDALEARIAQLETMEARLQQMEQLLLDCCNAGKTGLAPGTQPLPEVIRLADQPLLEQNNPNPFNQSTLIRYYLPGQTASAILRITDLSGQEIATYALQARGEGQVTIEAGRLSPGTYLYTLVLNGEVYDTKRMVLTR